MNKNIYNVKYYTFGIITITSNFKMTFETIDNSMTEILRDRKERNVSFMKYQHFIVLVTIFVNKALNKNNHRILNLIHY